MTAYRQSKLANLMFAFELDRRLRAARSRVMSVAAYPCVANTNLFRADHFASSRMVRSAQVVRLLHLSIVEPELWCSERLQYWLFKTLCGTDGLSLSPTQIAPVKRLVSR